MTYLCMARQKNCADICCIEISLKCPQQLVLVGTRRRVMSSTLPKRQRFRHNQSVGQTLHTCVNLKFGYFCLQIFLVRGAKEFRRCRRPNSIYIRTTLESLVRYLLSNFASILKKNIILLCLCLWFTIFVEWKKEVQSESPQFLSDET